jgi:hypothetical protein
VSFASFVSTRAQDKTPSVARPGDQGFVNWIADGGTSRSQRFSPLDQINVENVATLTKAWEARLGGGLPSSTPLVIDGVMYAHLAGRSMPRRGRKAGVTRTEHQRRLPVATRPPRHQLAVAAELAAADAAPA